MCIFVILLWTPTTSSTQNRHLRADGNMVGFTGGLESFRFQCGVSTNVKWFALNKTQTFDNENLFFNCTSRGTTSVSRAIPPIPRTTRAVGHQLRAKIWKRTTLSAVMTPTSRQAHGVEVVRGSAGVIPEQTGDPTFRNKKRPQIFALKLTKRRPHEDNIALT